MERTNETCICSRKHGYGCEALTDEMDGCLDGTCPFYKTEMDNKVSEAKARSRAEALGYHFKSRADVLNEMSYKAKYEKRHHAKAKGMKGIIKYNTYKNEYTEYDSIENCVRAEKIPRQKLEILLRTGEEWNGYRFIEA